MGATREKVRGRGMTRSPAADSPFAVDLLQEKRRQEEAAQIGEVGEHLGPDGEGEVALAEVAEGDEGILHPPLDDHQDDAGHDREDEGAHHEGAGPAEDGTAVEAEEEAAHGEDDEDGTATSRGGPFSRRTGPARGVLGQDEEGEDEGDGPDEDLEDEHPAPADGLDDGTADGHTEDGAAGAHQRPPAHGLDPVAAVEDAEDEGHGGGPEAGPHGAAEDTGEDEDADVGGGGRQGGHEEEVDHPDEIEATVARSGPRACRPAGP